MSMREKLRWADAVKGISMLFIVALHCGGPRIGNINPYIANILGCADKIVQGFVIVSVILGIHSYENRGNKSTKCWVVEHIIKLVPLYILAIGVTYIVRGPSYIWIQPDSDITILNLASHLLFLNFLVPNYINAFGIEWYVGVAIFVYIVIPILPWCVNSLKRVLFTSLAAILMCNILQHISYTTIKDLYPIEVASKFSSYFSPFSYIGCIGIGILLSFFYKSELFVSIKNNKYLSYALLCTWLFVIAIIANVEFSGVIIDTNTIYGFVSGLLIIALMIYDNPIFSNKVFVYIGSRSYIYYLFNYFVITVATAFLNKLVKISSTNIGTWAIKYVLCLILIGLLATALNKIYNKPIMILINRLFKSRKNG